MQTYFFDMTVRLGQEDRSFEAVLYRGARAEDELSARRIVLNRMLNGGFQVTKLQRVSERTPEPEAES